MHRLLPRSSGRAGGLTPLPAALNALLLAGFLTLGLASCQDLLNPLAAPENVEHSENPDFDPLKGAQSVAITPKTSVISALDATRLLSVEVRNGAGKLMPNPNITWRSLTPEVGTVNSAGRVTAIGVGIALITASANGAVDTATVEVRQVAAEVIVSPASRVLDVGGTVQLAAAAEDSSENRLVRDFVWSSARPEVAIVDQNGFVTALDTGIVAIQALAMPDSVGGTSIITVLIPPPAPPPGSPLPPGEWHRELRDTTIVGEVVVPAGESWLIGPNVQIAGNLRTDAGTIAMRPGSTLQFLGANPDLYIGGGHYYSPQFTNDIGLWVGAHGRLDISCTPKTSWNRTGVDPTWQPGDEYWIAPTTPGDFAPRRWYPGQPIPRIDPRVPAAEVANVTRDCMIQGPGHIHIHSHHPQTIEYVQLRDMGVSNVASNGPVLGRYALHLHHGGHGTSGTVIRGVAAVGSRGRVFVPHESHGVTMTDNVSVNSFAEGLWWDIGDRTDDTVVDRLLVMGVRMPGAISRSGFSGVTLGGGDRNAIVRSVVTGTHGRRHSHGFDWPAKVDDHGPALWHFGSSWGEANVAHNNEGDGVRLWLKTAPHTTTHFYTYRNGEAGVSTGRYRGNSRFANALIVDDYIDQNASSAVTPDGFGTVYHEIQVENSRGPALVFGTQNLPGSGPHGFADCTLRSGAGHPRVQVSATTKTPVYAHFVRCGITPSDIRFPDVIQPELEGTRVIIEHEDGRRWEIEVDVPNNETVITLLP